MNLDKAAKLATAASALVAVATMVASSIVWYRNIQEERIRDWQTTVVYSILSKAPRAGLKFEEVRSEYIKEAQAWASFDIPKKEIQESALRRVLLGLHSHHVVEVDVDGHYAVQATPPFKYRPTSDAIIERSHKTQNAIDEILAHIRSEPCRRTLEQLTLSFAQRVGLSNIQLNGLITSLIASNMLRVDENENLCPTTGTPPDPR